MNIYLNVSLYGDHVRFFKLSTSGSELPLYWRDFKEIGDIDDEILI